MNSHGSSLPPIITRGNSCASPFELDGRVSYASRMNVFFHNVVIVFTFLFTFVAVKRMLCKSSIFSRTTRNLLFYCMIYYIFHDIYFSCTLNWSFYRSMTQADDSCKIMFHGSECFFLYVIGLFVRVLLLYSQGAVTFERLIVTLLPNSDLINSGTLNTMTFIMAVITTSVIRPSTHSEFNSPNCFQQIYPGMKIVRSLLSIMTVFDVVCFPLNCIILIRTRRKFRDLQDSLEYNLKSRYNNKSNMESALIVSFVSFVQTLIYTFYIAGLHILFKMYTTEDGLFYGNTLALWFYTFPLAGLALPCSIILSIIGISIKKSNKIAVMKTNDTEQDIYFKKLAEQWNSPNFSRLSITLT